MDEIRVKRDPDSAIPYPGDLVRVGERIFTVKLFDRETDSAVIEIDLSDFNTFTTRPFVS